MKVNQLENSDSVVQNTQAQEEKYSLDPQTEWNRRECLLQHCRILRTTHTHKHSHNCRRTESRPLSSDHQRCLRLELSLRSEATRAFEHKVNNRKQIIKI